MGAPKAGEGGTASAMDRLREQLAEARDSAAAAAKTRRGLAAAEDKAEITVLDQTIAKAKELGLNEKELIQLKAQRARLEASETGAGLPSGRGGAGAANKGYEDFAAGEREKIQAAKGSADQIKAIYDEWLARAKTQFGEHSRQYQSVLREETAATQRAAAEMTAAQHQVLEDKLRGADTQSSLDQSYLQGQKALLGIQTDQGKTSKSGGETSIIAMTEAIAESEEKLYQQIYAAAGQDEAVKQEAYQKIVETAERAATAEAEAAKRAADAMKRSAEESARPFVQAFDSIGSGAERYLDQIVTGGTRSGEAVKSLARSIEGDLLSAIERVGSGLAAKGIGALLGIDSGGKGVGDVLGTGLAKLVGLGGGSAESNPAVAAATVAMTAQQKVLSDALTKLGTMVGLHITVQGANTAANTANTVATTANTGATAAAATSAGAGGAASAAGSAGGLVGGFASVAKFFGFHEGGIVPSAAGGFVVPGSALAGGGQLSILHPQENGIARQYL